jgi:hypothetical protein
VSLVLDLSRSGRRRSPAEGGDAVSLLRWGAADAAGGENVLFVSTSRRRAPDDAGVLLSLANTSPSQAVTLSVTLAGPPPRLVTGTVLTVPLAAPRKTEGRQRAGTINRASVSAFHGSIVRGKVVQITVPATSVVVLTLQ